MAREIILSCARRDGGVTIIHFQVERQFGPRAPKQVHPHDEAALQAHIDRENQSYVGTGMFIESWEIISPDDLPPSRVLRNAWEKPSTGGKKVEVNIAAGRNLIKDEVRRRRAEHFPELDAEQVRAMAQGNTEEVDRIEVRKQALRDLPAKVDEETASIADPRQLERYWPNDIPREKKRR